MDQPQTCRFSLTENMRTHTECPPHLMTTERRVNCSEELISGGVRGTGTTATTLGCGILYAEQATIQPAVPLYHTSGFGSCPDH